MKINKQIALGLAVFIYTRMVLFMALPLEGLKGYSDITHFYSLASIPGLPYIHYWVEYPPAFPFLSELVFWLAGGQQHVYGYLLLFLFTLADCGNLLVFYWLAVQIHPIQEARIRTCAYLLILVPLSYSWGYFDSLAVLALLLGLMFLLRGKPLMAGFAFGAGALIKVFPLLGMIAAWRAVRWKRAAAMAGVAIGLSLGLMGLLWGVSPEFTQASLGSQPGKGSWQTVWALLDENYQTGLISLLGNRTEPEVTFPLRGNPPLISPWLTLLIFTGLGLISLYKIKSVTPVKTLSVVGFAFCMFFLWLPGWIPQWVLFLLPLILISLPMQVSVLMASVMVLINLLEWPVLLSRGYFWSLVYSVPVRAFLLVLLAGLFFQNARRD
ncbi:MAG: glycosyltransferase 87 family protein [Anaerolineaceae bacterium]|nr:glycosyltransferase 87 family protein [Anaerolineaceae bacterium]